MSTYLDLAAALGLAALTGVLAVLVARLVTRSRATGREELPPLPTPHPRQVDRSPLGTRALPALLATATCTAILPLALWGLALRTPGVRLGALAVGLLVLAVTAVGVTQVVRRRGGLS